ncbi:hypothetical protein [Anatilimnocola floriformis]|uniref:hypothetical protein n=1 Tax=Anatilimnocola floriformis TaxID=2948575 RepID=UPI0020C3B4F8|nr:hypothetical protein [Anatilimnocola floriformis]
MTYSTRWSILLIAFMVSLPAISAQETKPESKPQKIDFSRARELARKRSQGEKLTAEEEAFVRRALDAYQAWQQLERLTGGDRAATPRADAPAPPEGRSSVGFKPLNEMTADDKYKGEDGGLFGEGKNKPPSYYSQFLADASVKIKPLDAAGKPAKDGVIGVISISMSNATQEFSMFKRIADADEAKSPRVRIVDCAQGGQTMAQWAPRDARPWEVAANLLTQAKVSPQQVQIAWVKLANAGPRGDLQEHGRKLEKDTLAVLKNAHEKFPNLRMVYLSSRIYGGYGTGMLNPEPYAYEGAFVVRWIIQDHMKRFGGRGSVGNDYGSMGITWGPYLWADGTTPRASDKLIYTREDLAGDGTHPSQEGRKKVADQLLNFFKTDWNAKQWFLKEYLDDDLDQD